MPTVNTYVTAQEVKDLIPGLTVSDPTSFDALVDRAARDVDSLLGPIPVDHDTGAKLDPDALHSHELSALKRAVAAQVEHLLAVEAAREAGPRQKSVAGPDFKIEYADDGSAGTDSRYGPRTASELEPLAWRVSRTARARP